MAHRSLFVFAVSSLLWLSSSAATVVVTGAGKLDIPEEVLPEDGAVLTGKVSVDDSSTADVKSTKAEAASSISFSSCAAEFVAMTLFVILGPGSAIGIAKSESSAWVLQVSLTFGFAIATLAYAFSTYSNQINCAVTLGLVLVGSISVWQGLLNFVAQMLGTVLGAVILTLMYPEEKDCTQGLGSNGVGEGWSYGNALVGEFMMTFLLVFTVLQTAVNSDFDYSSMACFAIGLAVFLGHSLLIPIDGCSINPTRSFGPAVVAWITGRKKDTFQDMWVFWVGPLAGAAAAAGVYKLFGA